MTTSPRRTRIGNLLVCIGIALLGALAQAQAVDSAGPLVRDSQAWVDQTVAASRPPGAAPLRMVVSVGALDSRLSLAPCAQVEPYVPAGLRLWGKTRIGVRCLDAGVRWNVFLPVQVKAFGQAWVVKGDIQSGKTLVDDDVVLAEVDWAQDNGQILLDPALWLGQTATRALGTGQALRQGMVRPAQVFQAGANVRVVAQGSGFVVSSDGQAVSPGVVGAQARVRMDNGRVLSGLVLDSRTVRVDM